MSLHFYIRSNLTNITELVTDIYNICAENEVEIEMLIKGIEAETETGILGY